MITTIHLRRGTAAQWTTADPILGSGEPGLETDTTKVKWGDGVTHWTALPYSAASAEEFAALAAQKGQPGGLATLDGGGFVPDGQIAATIARDAEVSAAVAAESTARDQAISTAINALVNGAPALLDTLGEIAAQLGVDESAAAALTTAVNARLAMSTYDANSIVKADADDTPVVLPVPSSTLIGRGASGVITALTVAQVKALLVLSSADLSDVASLATTTALSAAIASEVTARNAAIAAQHTADNGAYEPSFSRVMNRGAAVSTTAELARFTAPYALSAVAIATGVGTGDDIVEPAILFDASAPFLGYEYVLCASPYYQSNIIYENPCLWVSHDGTTWVPVVNGVPTPGGTVTALVAAAAQGDGNNSDPYIVRGPDGSYYVLWNQFLVATGSGGTGTGGKDWAIKGIKASSLAGPWSTPVTLVSTVLASDRPSTPSIFWDGYLWHMYCVDTHNTSSTAVTHYTNPASDPLTGTWTKLTSPTVAVPSDYSTQVWWHLNAFRMGSRHVLLMQDSTAGASAGGNLWLLYSDDGGVTWTVPPTPLLAGTAFYRASCVVTDNGSGPALDVFYGRLGTNWELRRTTAAIPNNRYGGIGANGMPVNSLAVLAAKVPVAPYVFGDTAVRADSATLIGTVDSGQTFTVDQGTLGISSNAIYAAVAAAKAHVNLTGCADGVFTARVSTVDPSGQTWLLCRFADTNNFIRFGCASGQWILANVVAGAVSQQIAAGTTSYTAANGDEIAIVCRGATVEAYLNGVRLIRATGWTANKTASAIGVQFSTTVGRLKNLTARPLVGGL